MGFNRYRTVVVIVDGSGWFRLQYGLLLLLLKMLGLLVRVNCKGGVLRLSLAGPGNEPKLRL